MRGTVNTSVLRRTYVHFGRAIRALVHVGFRCRSMNKQRVIVYPDCDERSWSGVPDRGPPSQRATPPTVRPSTSPVPKAA